MLNHIKVGWEGFRRGGVESGNPLGLGPLEVFSRDLGSPGAWVCSVGICVLVLKG